MRQATSRSERTKGEPRILLYSVVDRNRDGGVQQVLAALPASLRDRGFKVDEAWAAADEASANDNAWVCPLYVRRDPARQVELERPWHVPSLIRLVAGLARRRPQIVNIHFVTNQTLYFLHLRKAFGYKVVLSVHGSDFLKPQPEWADLLPYFLREADSVVSVSEQLARNIRAVPGVGSKKVTVIPNGVDTQFWSPGAGDAAAPELVSVGRLETVKGLDVLIAALARLKAHHARPRLRIIGDGPERAPLELLARDLGVGDQVTFAGSLRPSEVRQALRGAGIFVLPSRSEGMPLALIEAMASGTPVVASAVGGIPETVGEGAALLVEPDDPQDLADALGRLLADRNLPERLAGSGLQRVERFSAQRTHHAYADLFRNLAGETPQPKRTAA